MISLLTFPSALRSWKANSSGTCRSGSVLSFRTYDVNNDRENENWERREHGAIEVLVVLSPGVLGG